MSSEAARAVMGAFYETSTINTIRLARKGIPPIPRGKQVYRFSVGQTAYATENSTLKVGTPVKIAERYKEHGYCYYRGENGQVHREKDLTAERRAS